MSQSRVRPAQRLQNPPRVRRGEFLRTEMALEIEDEPLFENLHLPMHRRVHAICDGSDRGVPVPNGGRLRLLCALK